MQDYKYDSGKSRVDLIQPNFILGMGDILAYGATKYKENSWKTVKNGRVRYYAAALRHLLAYAKGERVDAETGRSHLLHAACCIMFLFYLEEENGNGSRAVRE